MTSSHLTHEQLCDLILASPDQPENASHAIEAAHDHLRGCLLCTAELQNLRTSLSLFRYAAHSYAEEQYTRPTVHKASIAPAPGYRSHILYWATAAVVSVAVILPLSLHRQPTPAPQHAAAAVVSPQTTESDEALLEGIDQDLSTDVPSPMQPLADPTGSTATSQSISDQRKN